MNHIHKNTTNLTAVHQTVADEELTELSDQDLETVAGGYFWLVYQAQFNFHLTLQNNAAAVYGARNVFGSGHYGY